MLTHVLYIMTWCHVVGLFTVYLMYHSNVSIMRHPIKCVLLYQQVQPFMLFIVYNGQAPMNNHASTISYYVTFMRWISSASVHDCAGCRKIPWILHDIISPSTTCFYKLYPFKISKKLRVRLIWPPKNCRFSNINIQVIINT